MQSIINCLPAAAPAGYHAVHQPIRPDPEPKWIPPRTRRTAEPYSNTAAASMAFMLRTAVFLFDGYECGRGYLKTSGEDW